MTVHGAKGLEAPIVILADTITPPAGPGLRQPRLLDLATDCAPNHFVWAGAKANDVAAVAAARERKRQENEDEHRRLLYVAMTRAIDRLVVCGAEGERGRPEGCWWNLIADALQPVSDKEPAEDGDGDVWRYRPTPAPAGAPIVSAALAPATPGHELPPWLEHDAGREAGSALPLSPSRAYDKETVPVHPTGGGSRVEREKAMARGVLVHRLLQSLPDIAPEARDEAARRHLARNGKEFSPEEQEAMLAQVHAVLDDPRFAELFSAGSRPEVSIVGHLPRDGGTVAVAGQVDRLVVTADSVLIADYKTNRPAPRRIDEVPKAYVTQLALYRAVLSRLYPDKTIRAVLIWTDVPDLMELSAASLDAALAAVTSA